ncbi:glycoside hydrolase family 16 protein [Pyxidicoccus fallax]|uniref:Glycoside hydrolase family 16 protein n=1 Tax=Pyxidicoccus fallax TaxID=394095 RepID=A0A848LHI4_9BACT|nr:glycoside hydrolase family 16 protein [Pyxidicoccus fallax]NMO15978.1 glycoside hydrolase family 16 protein [Pyxidicoccus fallax]NPC86496.1 glycoside hydrolase family 16 protein [Pyxidicoccus fallax]
MKLRYIGVLAALWFAGCGVNPGEDALAQQALALAGFEVSTPLSLNKVAFLRGERLEATVTYKNTTSQNINVGTLVVAMRSPTGGHADLSPGTGARTVAPGQTLTLTAGRSFTASDAYGTWTVFSSWMDTSGAWHAEAPRSITLLAPVTSRLTVTRPLALEKQSLVTGEVLRGSVTYQNTGTSPFGIRMLAIAGRRPDGSYADLTPALGARTLQAGESVTLAASRTLDQVGTWTVFSSVQLSDGSWREEAPMSVEVKASTPTGTWRLVWRDEFDGTGLPDATRWDYEVGYVRNSELQYYTRARLENARQENGQLILEARRDGWNGHDITSASIITKGKKSFLYGRVEVRAKLPTGKGTWPAFWMLGTDIDQVGWPACGEIDIMEYVGFSPTTIHGTVHTPFYYHGSPAGPRGGNTQASSPWLDYHLYAIEWFPDRIDFFVDSVKYFTFFNEGTSDKWPFNKPHYLLMNLAIGGSWGGQQGVDLGLFPHRVYVDYVRVYERL